MRTFLTIMLVLLAAIALTGCDKKSAPPAPAAQEKVTPQNLDSQLDKMEQEIAADAEAEEN